MFTSFSKFIVLEIIEIVKTELNNFVHKLPCGQPIKTVRRKNIFEFHS